jgi:hypothetical protein
MKFHQIAPAGAICHVPVCLESLYCARDPGCAVKRLGDNISFFLLVPGEALDAGAAIT